MSLANLLEQTKAVALAAREEAAANAARADVDFEEHGEQLVRVM